MPTYSYKAKDGPGRTVHGDIEADSHAAAVADLDLRGLIPVWVRERKAEGRGGTRRRRRVSRRDVTLFTRQLASLTRSGVPILRALTTIAEQTENVRFREVVRDLEATIRDGSMLSGALNRHPDLFPELYINMVRSGESGGVLDTILFRIADGREAEADARRKIQAAVAYPVLIVTVGFATVFVLLAFFMPRVLGLFDDYSDLPTATRILVGTSRFFAKSWHLILMVLLLFGAVLRRMAALEHGRVFFDRIALNLPLAGRFVCQSNIARFARTLALLIDAGVPIDRALDLSSETLHNAVLRAEMHAVRRETVQQGMSFSSGLKRAAHFPVLMANMSAVGEEAGRLDESLVEVAAFYDKEVEQQTRLATSLLEPVLILVVGAVVGFIVTAMLLPIFELSTGF